MGKLLFLIALCVVGSAFAWLFADAAKYSDADDGSTAMAVCWVFAGLAVALTGCGIAYSVYQSATGGNRKPVDPATAPAPTMAIVAYLIVGFGWFLSVGLFLYDNSSDDAHVDMSKYFVTIGISTAATVYTKLHGHQAVRKYFWSQQMATAHITPWQTFVVVALMLSWGFYCAWILSS